MCVYVGFCVFVCCIVCLVSHVYSMGVCACICFYACVCVLMCMYAVCGSGCQRMPGGLRGGNGASSVDERDKCSQALGTAGAARPPARPPARTPAHPPRCSELLGGVARRVKGAHNSKHPATEEGADAFI